MIESGDKVFIKVTNKDIYNEIKSFKITLEEFKNNNDVGHHEIVKQQRMTNGKVKLSKWMATTALSLVVIAIGIIVDHIAKTGG